MENESFSLNRARVLRMIKDKEPITIHELARLIGLPRSTLIHHLEQLKKKKLIKEKNSKEIKDTKEIGSPVYLTTNNANPLLNPTLKAFDSIIDAFKKLK